LLPLLLIALVAGLLGFGGIAGGCVEIAKIIVFIARGACVSAISTLRAADASSPPA
jgi:uncharacterized membrane protein YtjA (UPF0391 family)